MFSIVVPLYNKANFIKKTIDSVLNQTFQKFEVIIVDDGSSDNSLSVVKGLSDHRISVYTKPNGGVSSARNYGINKAKYDYIAFLDADDLWLPNYLENQYNLILKFPEAGMYSTEFKIQPSFDSPIMEDFNLNKPENEDRQFLVNDYCKAILERRIFCWTSSTCVKRDILSKVGLFREKIQIGEDIDLWLRIGLNTQVAYCYEASAIRITETENNLMITKFSLAKEFPYWEWYDYKTEQIKSLYRYTNMVLLTRLLGLIGSGEFEDSDYILSKIRVKFFKLKSILIYVYLYYKIKYKNKTK